MAWAIAITKLEPEAENPRLYQTLARPLAAVAAACACNCNR